MNNKIISLLILVGFTFFGYLYYNLEFKPKQILKKEEELKQKQEKLVEKKEVNLKQIIKDENTVNQDLDINSKIDKLKQKNNSYAIFDFDEKGIFSFIENDNKLLLNFNESKLGDFDKVDKKNIIIIDVIGTNNYYYIKIGNINFLYDLSLNKLNKLDLKVDIEYIKIGNDNMELLFKTNVGIFIYSIINNKFEYFNFFNDFVFFNNGYLGIINKDDKTRLNNLSINNDSNNLIIYYNPNTKEKNILYKTKLDLLKIYKIGEKIFFEDSENNQYELENLE